jgi:hypothetical protein
MEKMKAFTAKVKEIIVKKDYDWIHVIVGPEGIGKTSLAASVCKAVCPGFNIEKDSVFSYGELKRWVKASSPGDAVNIDEGALLFFSRDAMTSMTKAGVKLLTTIRTYNLFLTINIPNFWLIDKYLREHRVKTLSRIIRRGWLWHYSPQKVRMIRRHKKTLRTLWPEADFKDSFPDAALLWPRVWAAYKKKKAEQAVVSQSDKEKASIPMCCRKCGYLWIYTGILLMVQCPSCRTYNHVLHDKITNPKTF